MLNETDHEFSHCDHSIDGDIEEILAPHEFDNAGHPYWPEALHLARAAERVARELQRIRRQAEAGNLDGATGG